MVRSFPSRFVMPAIGVAALALFAALYVYHPYTYQKVMTAIITLPGPHPFVDWEWLPAAIECWTKALDVYVYNPCYAEVPNWGFNYSPLWLRITFIRYAHGWTNLSGLSLAVLFFVSLSFLPLPRNGRSDFLIVLFAVLSSVTVFAVERANADVVMFMMIVIGVSALGLRSPVRKLGYGIIMLAGLLKFYPFVALISLIRERPVAFTAIALAATAAAGGAAFAYHEEVVRAARNVPSGTLFHPLQFSAYELPNGLGLVAAKLATRLSGPDATSANAIGPFVSKSMLLLLILLALAAAIWFGGRCRLRHSLGQLDTSEARFLLVGAALICGCYFAGVNARYRAIFLLLALPGLLALEHGLPSRLARVAFRGTCLAALFVLWFPFVHGCVRAAAEILGKPVDLSDQRIDRAVRLVMWLGDQLAWWWVIIVLLAVLGAFVLNSELWDVLSRTLPFSRARVDTGLSREFRR
jgi:hypothetical protein